RRAGLRRPRRARRDVVRRGTRHAAGDRCRRRGAVVGEAQLGGGRAGVACRVGRGGGDAVGGAVGQVDRGGPGAAAVGGGGADLGGGVVEPDRAVRLGGAGEGQRRRVGLRRDRGGDRRCGRGGAVVGEAQRRGGRA